MKDRLEAIQKLQDTAEYWAETMGADDSTLRLIASLEQERTEIIQRHPELRRFNAELRHSKQLAKVEHQIWTYYKNVMGCVERIPHSWLEECVADRETIRGYIEAGAKEVAV